MQVAEQSYLFLSKTPSNEPDVGASKKPYEREGCCGRGHASHGRLQVTQEGHVRRAGERGRGVGEGMDRLRGRGLSGVWHHGRLEHHRTRPWGFVKHSMRRGV